MSFASLCKSFAACLFLASLCSGQQANTVADAGARPAIFQRGAQAVPVVASTASNAQLSTESLHVASNEEIDGMEQTLEHYVIAFENLNLAQVQQVWPELDQRHAKALKSVFASFKSYSSKPELGLQCAIPSITGDTANVMCTETVRYTVEKGKTKEAGPAKVSIELKGNSSHWVIRDMKGV
jgi:hypothetical protein